jgi:hypothetical protein
MYIRTTTRKYRGKTYTNYLLVESRHTPKGPRQKVICSLGDLKPRPKEEWLELARKVEAKLSGQEPLFDEPDQEAETRDDGRTFPRTFSWARGGGRSHAFGGPFLRNIELGPT